MVLGQVAWRSVLGPLLLLLARVVSDDFGRLSLGSNGVSNLGIEGEGVPLEVPDVGLHLAKEQLVVPLDVLDGRDFVPVEVVEGHPRNELLHELVVHYEAAALPALMDHQGDQTIVETRLVCLKEPIMKPVPDVIDLRGSLLHSNLIMINL